ncbi:MAG: cytochrome c peroxidase, partial [Gammaproteobacteria bacterium]
MSVLNRGLQKLFFVTVFAVMTSWTYAAAPLGTPSLDDIEYPDDEPPSQLEIELGKKLFFDVRLSLNRAQSCATCHNPDLGFGDGMPTSQGTMGSRVTRNAPPIYNLAWNVVFFWDGRAASLEEQALGPIESGGEMNLPMSEAVKRLSQVGYYRDTFRTVYGADSIEPELIGRAIAAFERTIISRQSPFDRFLAGERFAMSPGAVRGLAIFKGKARCTQCHDGANFTDNSFHNIGLNSQDVGRGAVVGDASFNKAFKTPGLRNVALTAPYMHDGSEPTLLDVVEFYDRGGDARAGISSLIQPLH